MPLLWKYRRLIINRVPGNCMKLMVSFAFANSVSGGKIIAQFPTDSSNERYLSEIKSFQQHRQQSDKAFSEMRNKQVIELQQKYETEKKDNELKLKDQAIRLQEKDIEILTRQSQLQKISNEKKSKDLILRQQAIEILKKQAELDEALVMGKDNEIRLNQKNIQVLTKQGELHAKELEQTKFIKTIAFAGIISLLIIVGLLYRQFRNKQKNNREVRLKNQALESLISEKEWLLKEIHHRVKHNLQTVVSLLETQAVYLRNDALAAIQDSQNRVQAMSLIHQSLYQGDNVTSINMLQYLQEVVNYLKEIFNVQKTIEFEVAISPMELDVSQAVPVGLILNEAVTNSIKYAFENHPASKKISIIMTEDSNNEITLLICDNGIGTAVIDSTKSGGLGLRLMRGLAETDMEGEFQISRDSGTTVSVRFTRDILSRNIKHAV